MDIHTATTRIEYINEEQVLVSLKWLRGASRYNNGATRYQNKYLLRLIISRAASRKRKEQERKAKPSPRFQNISLI